MNSINAGLSTTHQHPCPHFSVCSGCQLESPSSPPVLEEIKSEFPQIQLHSFSPLHWRMRAKLAVREGKIGLFQKGTHIVEDIPDCLVHVPIINEAAFLIKSSIKEFGIPIYEEKGYTGILRYIQCTASRDGNQVQLVVVLSGKELLEREKRWILSLSKHRVFHSIWVNFQPKNENVIFGSTWVQITGKEEFWVQMGSVEICLHPANFTQAHLEAFNFLIGLIVDEVEENQTVLELYAGVGPIGLNLSGKASYIRCTELNPFAENMFEKSASCLKTSGKVEFQTNDAKAAARYAVENRERFDVVVMDPPAKGCEIEVIEALCEIDGLKKILYVSCGYRSFIRDTHRLLERGWELQTVHGLIFFPWNDHVELLGIFTPK